MWYHVIHVIWIYVYIYICIVYSSIQYTSVYTCLIIFAYLKTSSDQSYPCHFHVISKSRVTVDASMLPWPKSSATALTKSRPVAPVAPVAWSRSWQAWQACWGSPWVSWWKPYLFQYLFQYLFPFSPGFAIPPVVFTSLPSHFNSFQFMSMLFSSATFDLWILFAMKHHRNCYSKNWWNPQWVFSDVFFQRFFGVQRVQRAQLYGHRTGSQRETSQCSALGPGEGRGHRLGALGGSGACSGARHLRYFRVDID